MNTETVTLPSVCPRCGIAHADAPERDRANALCTDCRETYGHRWTQLARDEVRRLARELDRWNEANARARAAYFADRRREEATP